MNVNKCNPNLRLFGNLKVIRQKQKIIQKILIIRQQSLKNYQIEMIKQINLVKIYY
jgi:hypothetical protein